MAKVVSKIMTFQHYDRRPLDDEISRRLFAAYIARLDPDRLYLRQSDIDEFSSFETILDELLYTGDMTIAYDLHARVRARLSERLAFAEQRVLEPLAAVTDATVKRRRDQAPWAASAAAQDELWTRQLQHWALLYFIDDLAPDADGQIRLTSAQADALVRPYRRLAERMGDHDRMDILEMFLSAYTSVYDPHSTYMAPMTRETFDLSMRLSFEGIGATLSSNGTHPRVVDIIPGGPAWRGGELKPGHRIIAVAQEGAPPVETIGMTLNHVVAMIRGEKGTVVYLTVQDRAAELAGESKVIQIIRDKVKLDNRGVSSRRLRGLPPSQAIDPGKPDAVLPPAVETDSTETGAVSLPEPAQPDGIAADFLVIDLPTFYSDDEARRNGDPDYRSTTRDVLALLLEEAGGKLGVILDLRGNGGGSMQEAIDLAGLFLPAGPIIQVRNPALSLRIHEDTDAVTHYSGPLVVLVDRASASSSEIVAGALQDYGRAVIVGERATHGKGTVQAIFPIAGIARNIRAFRANDPGSLKFTTAKFYRVSGGSTQLRGVLPDIAFASFRDHDGSGEESLAHALPWDTIDPVPIQPWRPDFGKTVATLRHNCEDRLAADPLYQERLQLIDETIADTERDYWPLDLAARRELAAARTDRRQRLRAWNERAREPYQGDFMLHQAMLILRDWHDLAAATQPH